MSRDTTATNSLIVAVLVTLSYALLGRLSLFFAVPPGFASPVWIPAGIAVAAWFVHGAKVAPAILVGSFIVNATTGPDPIGAVMRTLISPWVALGIALGATLQAGAGAWLARRWVGPSRDLDAPRDAVGFLLAIGPIACLTATSVGHLVLWFAGLVSPDQLVRSVWAWWLGDTIGALAVAPITLALIGRPRETWRPRVLTVAAPLTLVISSVLVFAFETGQAETRRVTAQLEQECTQLTDAVHEELARCEEVIQSLRSFWRSSDEVTRNEFETFTREALQ
ncbi:MAG: MASE1 domain-containing protein, partial [Planctomycetota bacterium]